MIRVSRAYSILMALAITFSLCTPVFAAKRSSSSSRMVDIQAAITAWNIKPKKDETTAALEKRVKGQITELLNADLGKLDYDTNYWRLLSYLREYSWEKMSSKYKSWYLSKQPNLRLTPEQRKAYITQLKDKPIYKMTPKEVDVYLGYAQEQFPNLRERVIHLARKNLNQPYDIYLLGEFPHEVYDPEPMFNLAKSDCVVFSEHTYAMALSRDWKQFYSTLQRIRYKNGEVGMVTRNHYTEADWDKNNSWLVEDVTNSLGATTVTKYTEKIDRAAFFKKFGLGEDVTVEMLEDTYIPADAVEGVLDKLQDGDFVNVVRGVGEGVWVGHVGLIGHGKDGQVHFIHSTPPKVTEVPIMNYVKDNVKKNKERAKSGKAQFMGFKFLRLRDNPTPPAPSSTAPAGQ